MPSRELKARMWPRFKFLLPAGRREVLQERGPEGPARPPPPPGAFPAPTSTTSWVLGDAQMRDAEEGSAENGFLAAPATAGPRGRPVPLDSLTRLFPGSQRESGQGQNPRFPVLVGIHCGF